MTTDKIKQQRDRFLAFAFASSDFFIEVDENGGMSFTLGAARSLAGVSDVDLLGRSWLSMFSANDHDTLNSMRDKAIPGSRCGPHLVKLDFDLAGDRQAIVTGIKMPGSENFYLTAGFTNDLMSHYADRVKGTPTDIDPPSFEIARELLNKDSFMHAAQDAFVTARAVGSMLSMTLIDIDNIDLLKQDFDPEKWDFVMECLGTLLNSKSFDGHSAAEIKPGHYSIIHDNSFNADQLKDEIMGLFREHAAPEKATSEIDWKTVSADLASLSERDTTKALIYTINEFERKGTSINIESLNSGFKNYVSTNAQKILQFKTMIEQLNFDLFFQPIVDLRDESVSHFEMLSRFRDDTPTQEWIIFGEDIGMAAEFDIAVCERAINYLLYKSQGRSTKFAINLSGQSIQNEQFFKTLLAKLMLHPELAKRMIFEITESTTIQKFDLVQQFIKILQGDGYKVCLDDFGAGSASFQYIQHLPVDYVKIDGAYTRKINSSERDKIMVKNLNQMCQDLNIKVIAEKIETDEQARMLKSLGIGMGQGYLYAMPSAKPEFTSREKP